MLRSFAGHDSPRVFCEFDGILRQFARLVRPVESVAYAQYPTAIATARPINFKIVFTIHDLSVRLTFDMRGSTRLAGVSPLDGRVRRLHCCD